MPLTPEETRIRAFIFKLEGPKLVCTNYWATDHVAEAVGVTFEINSQTEKQVAVVKSAVKKQVCAVAVSVLPENLEGVDGKVERDLCFIVAAPIIGPKGKVWGTVDFDASNSRGENLLRNNMTQSILYELGRHLYSLLALK